MKNQVKVKETSVHTSSYGNYVVCEGVLRLIKSNVEDSVFYKDGIGLMKNNGCDMFGTGEYLKPVIISKTEEIKDEDSILHKEEILTVSKNRGHYLSIYEFTHIDVRADLCNKILVKSDNFSPKQLQAILDGKLKDGMNVLVECEGCEVDYVTSVWSPKGSYIGKQIKLDSNNHIKLFGMPNKEESLSDRLFKLANDFAVAKEGDIAVQLHLIRNRYARQI